LQNIHHVFTSADRIPEGKKLDGGIFTSVGIMPEGKKPPYENSTFPLLLVKN